MQKVTLKIVDPDVSNDRFYLFVGNFGTPMSISRLKEVAKNTHQGNISQEALYYICALLIFNRAAQLGIDPRDMTLAQLKNAVEVEVTL